MSDEEPRERRPGPDPGPIEHSDAERVPPDDEAEAREAEDDSTQRQPRDGDDG